MKIRQKHIHIFIKIYYNLISYKEPFEQILKIIDNIDPKNILNSNNIELIANLKFYLSIDSITRFSNILI